MGLVVLAAASLASAAFAQTAIYQTDFESSGDISGTNFPLGSLGGVGGWTLDAGGTANVANTPLTAASGSNYVALGANTSISRNTTSASARVIMRGFYFGTGSATLQVPDSATPMAAVLGFRTINASTFTVAAFDGNSAGYVEASGPPSFSNTAWHKIVVSLNYTAHTYDVAVDNAPLLQGVHFRDNTVSALTGFQSFSETSSNIDKVGFFSSTGDADGDGISDDTEMATAGNDPLDAALPGVTLGDLDGNHVISPGDAQAAFQCFLTGTCTSAQINAADVSPNAGAACIGQEDGDGAVTPSDAQRIFNLFMATETACP